MKKHLLSSLILSLTLAACSASQDKTSTSAAPHLPTELIFASPKVSPVTAEMKALYKDWATLVMASKNSHNCQVVKKVPLQKTNPIFSGDIVKINSKNELSGFYCPVQGANSWSYKATVVTHDRTQQILNLTNELTASSEVSVLDPKLTASTDLSSMKTIYTMNGPSIYKKGIKTNEYNQVSYVATVQNAAGENITLSTTGEITEMNNVKNIKLEGILKNKTISVDVMVFEKDGVLKTFLNGNAINEDDQLPTFPLPEWSSPSLENTNL